VILLFRATAAPLDRNPESTWRSFTGVLLAALSLDWQLTPKYWTPTGKSSPSAATDARKLSNTSGQGRVGPESAVEARRLDGLSP